MKRLNRDVYVAIFLLIACGVFFWQTSLVPQMGYASIEADVWPKLIVAVLLVLTLLYLLQSLRDGAPQKPSGGTVMQLIGRYRNALWCYGLFFLFLATLNWLGMLIGGTLFVFLTLTAIGDRSMRAIGVHAAVAIGSMAGMWAIFTFALHVILPTGNVLSAF